MGKKYCSKTCLEEGVCDGGCEDSLLPTEGHRELFRFYNVDNYYDLVDIQSEQISRLQKRLSYPDKLPRTPREG